MSVLVEPPRGTQQQPPADDLLDWYAAGLTDLEYGSDLLEIHQDAVSPATASKIVLQGLQYFTDLVLKLRDRGDISRRSAVQAGGFDYDAEVQARKREKPDDRIMTAPVVPFSGAGGQQDPQGGRPRGGSRANGAPGSQPSRSTQDPARPRRTIQRTAGETVRAIQDHFADKLLFSVKGLAPGAVLCQTVSDRARGR